MERTAAHHMATFLALVAPDIDWDNDPHFDETAERFTRMMVEACNKEEFKFTTFPTELDEMIVQTNIPFNSLCAHHLVPFIGRAHVAYIPQGRLCGLSKLARTVKYWAKGFQIQEDLTVQIADFLEEQLDPHGVAVVLEAEHMCMSIRGVRSFGAKTTTSAMRGVFSDHSRLARNEFLALIKE